MQKKTNKQKSRWLIYGVIAIVGLLFASVAVWAASLSGDKISRIAGVKQLEKLGFTCDGSFTATNYHRAICEIDSHRLSETMSFYQSLKNGDEGEGDDYEDENKDDDYEVEPDIEESLLAYPWIWHDTDPEEAFIHAGSRQIIHGYDDHFSYGTYEFATGYLPTDVGSWVVDLEEQTDEPLDLSSQDDIWIYIGPLSNSTTCDRNSINELGLEAGAAKVRYTYLKHNPNNGSRAVMNLYNSYTNPDANSYCVRAAYIPTGQEKIKTHWLKVTIPLEEFWEQIQNESPFARNDFIGGLGTTSALPPEYSPSTDEEPDKISIRIDTFKNESTKEAYFVKRIDRHPCSTIEPGQFVLEGELFIGSVEEGHQWLNETEYSQLAEAMRSLPRSPVWIVSEDGVDNDDFETIAVTLHDAESCQDVLKGIVGWANICASTNIRAGRCSGGIDRELLRVINEVADDCQAMYDRSKESGGAEPTARDLADCLQIDDSIRQDFIDNIQIIGPDDRDYGKLLMATGYYRFNTRLPYVLWDQKTEDEQYGHRFQFELVALHEYMHKLYSQDMSLRDRMRLHQEILSLMENEENHFFDFSGHGNLKDESRHRIVRHGAAHWGLEQVEVIINNINGIKEDILSHLPENIKDEYADFLEDRHGLVAFIYALAETQIMNEHPEQLDGALKENNILAGIEVDNFIAEGYFEQILEDYIETLSDNENEQSKFVWYASLDLTTKIPHKIRYDGDSSFYNYNLGTADIDIFAPLRAERKDWEQSERKFFDQVQKFLDGEFHDMITAALTEYRQDYRKSTSLLTEMIKRIYRKRMLVHGSIDKSLNIETAQAFVDDISEFLSELSPEDAALFESRADEYGSLLPPDELPLFDDPFHELLFRMHRIADKHDFIDYGLASIFATLRGFMAEGYPILALETPVALPEWLEQHYEQYFDREALSKYFKYHPGLNY